MIRLRARIKELKFSYEYGWYSLELSIHYLYQIAVFVKQQTIRGSFLFAYCIFVSFSALLRGDLCKSGPGHFASEKSFPSNFAQ